MAKAFVNGIGLVEKQKKSVEYTENGSYEVAPDKGHLLDGVTVNVATPEAQEKSLDVTADGSYTVIPDEGKVLSQVTVNVDTPDKKEEQIKSLEVTENGDYTVLPDEGKVLSRVFVNVDVPDGMEELEAIDAELDAIIAHQNELMGVLAFTVTYSYIGGGILALTFKEGMTWREWCDSEYNTEGYYIREDGAVCAPGNLKLIYVEYGDPDYIVAEGEDAIIANHQYRYIDYGM